MNNIISKQMDYFNIDSFIEKTEKLVDKNFDINFKELFINLFSGNIFGIFNLSNFKNLFMKEILLENKLIISILIIIIINSILKIVTENLSYETGKIVNYIEYLLVVSILIESVLDKIYELKNVISNLVVFLNLLIPLLITLVITTGNFISSNFIQPVLIIFVNLVGNIINNFFIPILLISFLLYIISNISNYVRLNKLADFLKSSTIWILGIIFTIFTSLLSIEGTLSSSVDGFTSKTAKAAVTNFIPVFGKIMGDSFDSVIGASNILKNTIGTFGSIVIILIVIKPIISLSISFFSIKLFGALTEAIGDEKIVKIIDKTADIYKVLLAIILCLSIMFVIGITIVLNVTNSSLMYR